MTKSCTVDDVLVFLKTFSQVLDIEQRVKRYLSILEHAGAGAKCSRYRSGDEMLSAFQENPKEIIDYDSENMLAHLKIAIYRERLANDCPQQ
ncbi:hypothetical protein PoB_007238900 [Plakobranchus ocellatus]|uniref:Uncharacterized protein n=1 Tax=Plakobranchus ocellatus TaxID=259542 RepID=A0AAV4DPE6_9GAST|nr:hypothetical protein PoB_007238900 [Plakobranchus ocellatus]